MHQHLIARLITFKKRDMGRVPPARFPWQQQDHSRWQLFVNKQNVFDWRRSDFVQQFLILNGYGAKRLIKEFFTKGWKKTTLNDFLKQLRDTVLAEHKAGSGRPRTARTDENINLFDELVLSQEHQHSLILL